MDKVMDIMSLRKSSKGAQRPIRAFHGRFDDLEERRLLSVAPPAVGGSPIVNPADFRVTEFATGLSFPTGLLTMADGSLLASITIPTDPSYPDYYESTGEVVRFTDSTGTGVADNAGTVLYSGLPGPLTDLQQAGPYIVVTNPSGQISFLHMGATASSPLTFCGRIQLDFPADWEHETYGLAVRPTPGVAGSYDVLFNVGSQYNGIEEDASGNIIYGSNGIAVPEPTTGDVTASGLIGGTLSGDSIYMVRLVDDNGTPVLSDLTQVATGLRNAASMVFDSAGDLYLADNGIDGTDGGYYGFSTDTLQMMPAAEIGVTVPNFGFPYSYTLTNQAPGEPVTAVNPSQRVTPLASFEPLGDPNLPGTGSRSQGAAGIALSPPMFPAGLNAGVFIGFHGVFDSGGTANDKNPMLFVDPGSGSYFDFISNEEPNIGHLDGAASTENAIFVSDISSNGQLWGSPSTGIIYEIEAINHAPVVAPIAAQTVTAGETLTVPVKASDQDPGQTLVYSLASAPVGAKINAATGVVTWTPPVGVTAASIIVKATDDGVPPMSGTAQFDVAVKELPPVIEAIPAQEVNEGTMLSVQVSASNPYQSLSYSLGPGAPAGASINPVTGVFTWTPPVGSTVAAVTVVVADQGDPSVTASTVFNISVNDVAPTVTLVPTLVAARPKTVKQEGTFTDPGDETWTATVNYGDGSKTKSLPLSSSKTFLFSHDYKRRGIFTAVVTVTDSLGESGTATLMVAIARKKPKVAVKS